eukprot:scaffold34763_cov82-Phaeocystis_antarctica.AAC.6
MSSGFRPWARGAPVRACACGEVACGEATCGDVWRRVACGEEVCGEVVVGSHVVRWHVARWHHTHDLLDLLRLLHRSWGSSAEAFRLSAQRGVRAGRLCSLLALRLCQRRGGVWRRGGRGATTAAAARLERRGLALELQCHSP